MAKPAGSSKIYDLGEAREKIRNFCAYRERSQLEVREKLSSYGLIEAVVDELIVELINENFLNEERFARAFVRGKFQIKKWGRRKINSELYRHGLSDYIMRKAFAEIDEEHYLQTLAEIIQKKLKSLRGSNNFERRGKLASYAISRGFEPELVWDAVKQELPD